MSLYGTENYWDARYRKDPDSFDWYVRWNALQDTIGADLSPDMSILHVGCGTSKVTEDLYEAGFHNLHNIDISQVAIETMANRFKEKPEVQFIKMSVCNMNEFTDAKFDAIIDKGTLDSILCGEDFSTNVQLALAELSRVLKSGGRIFIISFGKPVYRLSYLKQPDYDWDIEVKTVKKPSTSIMPSTQDDSDDSYYIYVCTKNKKQR